MPDADLPPAAQQRDNNRPSAALVALLKVLLAAKAEQHNVAAKLVARSDDIDRLALEDNPRHPGIARMAAGCFRQ